MIKQDTTTMYQEFLEARQENRKLLSILIDPDKFNTATILGFLKQIPQETTHIFVGGSTVVNGATEAVVAALKFQTQKPILLFPGDVSQITGKADGLLFLSLLSGNNPEYLIGQHIQAIPKLRGSGLAILSTGYVLIDGGNESAVARVTGTEPMSQQNIQAIVDTAKAGELLGMKLIYLEAGSGAKIPVSAKIITAVKNEINIPLIVGGGIRTEAQKQTAYKAGANMVVMGTQFEGRSTKV
ncbi:geranylgeranylglyceryl/heptaprenylglyceryl phosphate synthase [Rasiella sp. SM2506]|uniref:geranylgeranylglyceryl/heptaprenylglyceryl phosphate synthase n=1 Tax=Rasiella sp. SM2506 TaxID=3423914 RepID=UPI003D78F7B3